jgi:hypothetical protein
MNRKKLASVFAAIAISGMMALGTQRVHAQAIVVTTPFAFTVGNQDFPAGTYQLTRLSEWSLSIRNVNSGGERFFPTIPGEDRSPEAAGGAGFRNAEGHKTLLAVYVPGTDRSLKLIAHTSVSPNVSQGATFSTAFIAASMPPGKTK